MRADSPGPATFSATSHHWRMTQCSDAAGKYLNQSCYRKAEHQTSSCDPYTVRRRYIALRRKQSRFMTKYIRFHLQPCHTMHIEHVCHRHHLYLHSRKADQPHKAWSHGYIDWLPISHMISVPLPQCVNAVSWESQSLSYRQTQTSLPRHLCSDAQHICWLQF